ncbi:MAG: DNA translocase FtsK 4TM domain-containing protein [Rhodospirillales bacterium]
MAQTFNLFGGGKILPPGAQNFLKKRGRELIGFSFVICALWGAIAVFGYSAGDPSLNSSGIADPSNILGTSGALVADLLLQTLGFTCFVPILTLFVWGGRLMCGNPVLHPLRSLLLLIVACLFYAITLSALPVSVNWPLMTRMGGFTGSLLMDSLVNWQWLAKSGISVVLIGAISGFIGVILWVTALGLTRQDWQRTAIGFLKITIFMRNIVNLCHDIWKRVSEFKDRNFQSPEPSYFTPPSKITDVDEDVSEDFDVRISFGDTDDEYDKASPSMERSGLVADKPSAPKLSAKLKATSQRQLDLGDGIYQKPPLDLLEARDVSVSVSQLNKDALQQNAKFLGSVLSDFGIKGEIVKVRPGPVVTLYELEPAPGTKSSRVIGLSGDIARSMSAVSVRIAVVPGQNVIGIELPNLNREIVYMRELVESKEFEKSTNSLPLALGKDIGGMPVIADLIRMPHLLIAGTTGSGKSVAMNTMILSLLYQLTPDQCKFIMIDPKMLELSVYEGIPHLLTPVVTDPSKAVVALKWAVREMEDRYRMMSQIGVRNVAGYNVRIKEAAKKGETLTRTVQTGFDDDGKPIMEELPLPTDPLPFIVVVVDEMADLMLVAGKDVEAAIQRLAQMARAAGIHLIMATQRPSVDVITGTIKANFPTRISFQVTSKIDSRTILGEQGAEQLLGQGDMLYMAGGGRITRVHGPFVSDEDVEEIVKHLKAQGSPAYLDEITVEDDTPLLGGTTSKEDAGDVLYDEAVALIAREGKASTSFIQRHLQIGYNRAARIIERMEKQGVVSEANRVGKREVLIGNH